MSQWDDACKRYDEALAAIRTTAYSTPKVERKVRTNSAPQPEDFETPAPYAKSLTQWLYKRYHIVGRIEIRPRLRRSYFTYGRDGRYLIRLGMQSIGRAFNTGFVEYSSLRCYLGRAPIRGWAGVRQLVIHEFAHALCEYRGHRRKGSVHNYAFVKACRELMELLGVTK